MHTRRARLLGLGVLLALAAAGCGRGSPTTDDTPCFLWKVKSPTNSVYVLGSVHAGKKEFYPLAKGIEDAFDQSQALVVEIDQTRLNPATAAQLINTHGVYPPGQSLSQSISKETLASLRKYCAGKGVQVASLDRYRPWTLTLLLAVGEMKAAGYTEEFGHDRYFTDRAKKINRLIIELETIEEQIALFSKLSPKLQETLLEKTLGELSQMKDYMEKTWAAWQAGDAQAMAELLVASSKEHPEFLPLFEKTFSERNGKMVERIEDFLRDRQPYFVVVGAGHLVGEKGIVRLLSDKNYQVEQVRRSGIAKKAA